MVIFQKIDDWEKEKEKDDLLTCVASLQVKTDVMNWDSLLMKRPLLVARSGIVNRNSLGIEAPLDRMREQSRGEERGRRQRRPFILKRPIVALNGGGREEEEEAAACYGGSS